MAAIVVNSVTSTVSGSLYKDLLLDVKIDYTRNPQLLKRREVSDIQISENINAIKEVLSGGGKSQSTINRLIQQAKQMMGEYSSSGEEGYTDTYNSEDSE